MAHIDLNNKIFPTRTRSLSRKNLKNFIESFTGIRKYTSSTLRCAAIRDIVEWMVEHLGDDLDGYTYAHQYLGGPRLRRFTIWRFPLDPQPDRLSVRTNKKEVVEDTGWFGVEPDDEMMWTRVLETFLIEMANKLLSRKEIHFRLGGPVKEKPVESEPLDN